ncbi:putative Uncharacterized transporter [Glarea lozoyensis 74030]|uniref:Putative Uncharacterized transporter n=1 Tax=Glarea lozoyensis (strain ATCC 74030 / MF5533) TaxID=1104152 RepID=H0EUS7_GLAL7|nr:putative Uncharacterized transporter [Glarea lozoyensis 74030]
MEEDKMANAPQVTHEDDIGSYTAPVPKNVQKDEETAAYVGQSAVPIDEKTNKELFWTINRRILACIVGTYFCQSLDKGTLGFASIMGIRTDAHLVGQQFSWLGTILYMGVLVGEYPTNLLLQKLPVAKYLATNVFLWGIVIACSAAAKDFKAMMVVRFLLGLFESCVQPAFIIIEQTVLTSLWYCMVGVQLMVGGIIAWGASHFVGHAIYSWQLLFLALGLLTCVWGLFIGWWLPDSPMSAKCFTEDQKRLMVERVRSNETGIQNKTYKVHQTFEAIKDPLLNIAQGAVTIMVMVGGATLAQTTGQTLLVMHVWTIPPIIGTAIIYSIPPSPSTRIGLLIAFYCTQFFLAEGNLVFSLISRNVAGQTKKSTTLAITFVAWAAGNMTAPQIFQAGDAPRYKKGFTAHFCLYVLFNIFAAVLRVLLTRRNKEKRQAAANALAIEATEQVDEKISHPHAFEDLTDKENPDFSKPKMAKAHFIRELIPAHGLCMLSLAHLSLPFSTALILPSVCGYAGRML